MSHAPSGAPALLLVHRRSSECGHADGRAWRQEGRFPAVPANIWS